MKETRWLSESEQASWLAFLRANKLFNDRLDRDLQDQFHISLPEYEVLAMLSAEPMGLRMATLAEITVSSKPRTTHCVDRLAKQGYVQRQNCPTDKRGLFAQLTPAGRALLKKMAPIHVEGVHTHFIDQMTETQRKTLTTVMRNIETSVTTTD